MKRAFSTLFLLILLGVSAFTFFYRQEIKDEIKLYGYEPSPEIEQLAGRVSFSEKGQDLFYVTDPQLLDRGSFNASCPTNESSIVLGCYTGDSIFIYNVQDERLEGVQEVTAAHEMLHAAYERLSLGEREPIDKMLLSVSLGLTDDRVLSVIDTYSDLSPDLLNNELHSIFATEVNDLPPELEEYYSQYFSDRRVIVAISDQYEQVFVQLEEQVADYKDQLSTLRFRIDGLEAKAATQQSTLQSNQARLDAFEQQQDIASFNRLVPIYNAQVKAFNSTVNEINALISSYDSVVREHNDLAATQGNLIDSIDSRFESL